MSSTKSVLRNGESKYESLASGVVKRRERRVVGVFIDGTGLDRATRRINKKVDLSRLVKGVCSGMKPIVARYYTLIPYEDDSRQRAFLDAVQRAGLTVIVKRLPPKGITRQVSVDIEMAADITAFALGHSRFSEIGEYDSSDYTPQGSALPSALPRMQGIARDRHSTDSGPVASSVSTAKGQEQLSSEDSDTPESRIITLVCPSRELTYPISLCKDIGVDTATADFGQFNTGDILRSAAKWIDLSDSETIWRES